MRQNINNSRRSWYTIRVYLKVRAWEPFDESPYGWYTTNKRVRVGDYAVVKTEWGVRLGVVAYKKFWKPSSFKPNSKPYESPELLEIIRDIEPYKFLGYHSPTNEAPFEERKKVLENAIEEAKERDLRK